MIGLDGKFLPEYKKKILKVTGYNNFKKQLVRENSSHLFAQCVSKNPFLILPIAVTVKENTIYLKVHMIRVFIDRYDE